MASRFFLLDYFKNAVSPRPLIRHRAILCVKGSQIDPSEWKKSILEYKEALGKALPIWLVHIFLFMFAKDWCMIKIYDQGFPGGAVVENLPANAGDTGSSPGLGRSHMPRSDWAREPQLLSLHVWSLCSATREAAIVRGPRIAMKSGPHLPQLERALAQKRRPNTAINKINK